MDSITTVSPGRINLIGEHTDYNDGFVLPAAIDKSTKVFLQKNASPTHCKLVASNLSESFEFDLEKMNPIEGGWQNYVMGVVNELQKMGAKMAGFDAKFEGDVPIGAGMSSSASLECSFAFALNELFRLGFDKLALIKAAQMAEHNFVGIKCGIMDQFASVMGRKNHAMLLDCRDLTYQYFPLELGDYQLLLLNSNVAHSLASSEYNIRRAQCEEGVALIKKRYEGVTNLRDINLEQLSGFFNQIPLTIFKRCYHVVSENQRVLEATTALQQQDFLLLGELLYQSHFSLQNDYEVSCKEIDFLVQLTLDKKYVLGSRIMGGGFGGCTISLIEKDKTNDFIQLASEAYWRRFKTNLSSYTVLIEDGARVVT